MNKQIEYAAGVMFVSVLFTKIKTTQCTQCGKHEHKHKEIADNFKVPQVVFQRGKQRRKKKLKNLRRGFEEN